jgi:hypothetical protein
MTEILSCTSVSEPTFNDIASFPTDALKGLAAIKDTLEFTTPPYAKPPFFQRAFASIGLWLVHSSTFTIRFFYFLRDQIHGSCEQKKLCRELHKLALEQDVEKIESFLEEAAQKDHPTGFLMGEFLALPELHDYLSEILKGANVCLKGDGGFFCHQWNQHPESYKRISSHKYQGDHSYALGYFLFWIDLEGNTRFQFEKSPLRGFRNHLNHVIDYLHYKRDNKQIGIAGKSMYTETHCLNVQVDPAAYLFRK